MDRCNKREKEKREEGGKDEEKNEVMSTYCTPSA